jgi:hypothetical protein
MFKFAVLSLTLMTITPLTMAFNCTAGQAYCAQTLFEGALTVRGGRLFAPQYDGYLLNY